MSFDFPVGLGSTATVTSVTYSWQTEGGFPRVDYTPEAGSITVMPGQGTPGSSLPGITSIVGQDIIVPVLASATAGDTFDLVLTATTPPDNNGVSVPPVVEDFLITISSTAQNNPPGNNPDPIKILEQQTAARINNILTVDEGVLSALGVAALVTGATGPIVVAGTIVAAGIGVLPNV
jgi:hypothetical protein